MFRSLFAALGLCEAKRSLRDVIDGVNAFVFDRQGVDRPFSVRLAEKTAWSEEFARRVIDEYRRYVVLAYDAACRGRVAVPSLSVDEAWHLHLQDTSSYWHRLCGDVLGREIHHYPAESSTEDGEYKALYAQTYRRYVEIFGSNPPADIWGPAPDELEAAAASSAKPKRSASRAQDSAGSGGGTTDAAIFPMFFGDSGSSADHSGSSIGDAPSVDASSAASCGSSSSAASCGGASAGCASASCGGASAGCGGGGCGGGGCGGG